MLKYGSLIAAMLILFGFVPKVISDNSGTLQEIISGLAIPIIIAILLLIWFFKMKGKIRYVAIGRSKVVIKKKGNEVEHGWIDVEEISLNSFLGVYKLKMKGEEHIYFTAYGSVGWFTGHNSDMGVIIAKMKNELQI